VLLGTTCEKKRRSHAVPKGTGIYLTMILLPTGRA